MKTPQLKKPADLSVEAFDYNLPPEKIATHPLAERDQSKLLIYKKGIISEDHFFNIAGYLQEGSLMVFNESKVVQARLHFKTSQGATVEIFCLEPANNQGEINQWMQKHEKVQWRCMIGELKKWKEKCLTLDLSDEKESTTLTAELISREQGTFIIEFTWFPAELTFGEILEKAGKMPLPPYIKREAKEEDKVRYQTIYAKQEGSVAAPTAGLHYTPRIFNDLHKKSIETAYLTLHVGAGTFKPVKSPTLGEHEMHSEQILVEKWFIEKLLQSLDKNVVAVGTTSLRTLESLYWLGLRINKGMATQDGNIEVGQWDPYEMEADLSPADSLRELINFLNTKKENVLLARTQLLIAPGYQWKIVNVLSTNFHQPKSTLILLVAAFVGDDWKKIYQHALENDYRFLSYGDGSLLIRG